MRSFITRAGRNSTERSVRGVDAALCQITLTTRPEASSITRTTRTLGPDPTTSEVCWVQQSNLLVDPTEFRRSEDVISTNILLGYVSSPFARCQLGQLTKQHKDASNKNWPSMRIVATSYTAKTEFYVIFKLLFRRMIFFIYCIHCLGL